MTTELGEAVARCKNLTRDGRDINTVNVNCDDLETILAELGRLSRPSVGIETILSVFESKSADFENGSYSGETVLELIRAIRNTRPPALGELSDEQWYALLNVMDAAAADAASINDSWEDINKNEIKAAGKAAREFLGKVDG